MPESFRSPRKIARRLRLLPLVAGKVTNWLAFTFNYALGLTPEGGYRFRNGARIRIGRGIDHVPIIEIFLKEDYGKMPDNAVIVDLGANIGVFTIYATTTANNVKVYAYEPLTKFFDMMEANVRLNGQEKSVQCFNLAVAGKAETRTLYVKGTDFYFPTLVGNDRKNKQEAKQETTDVECTTIANIFESNKLKQIDILKMDCEGAEYEILYQTPAAYFERIKEIRMEYHNLDNNERRLEHLREFLKINGYAIAREQATSETNGSLWAERR
jgi:FkbM family methyltransferase